MRMRLNHLSRFTPSISGIVKGVALAASLSMSTTLFADAAAAAAPTPGSATAAAVAPRQYTPRAINAKRDPVEALLPRSFVDEFYRKGLVLDTRALTGAFVVKFRDDIKARAPLTPDVGLTSLSGADVSRAEKLLHLFGGSARQWIRKSEGELSQLESRAREHSGRQQADLAGMIYITGVSMDRLFEAGRAFSDLDQVEFVSFERHAVNLQDAQGCDPNNQVNCELPSPTCTEFFPNPTDDGVGRTSCNPPTSDPRTWGCNDQTCCESVGDLDPTCVDENDADGWDVYCAAYANMICPGTIYDEPPATGPYDPCFYDPLQPDRTNPVFRPVVDQFQNLDCVTPHPGAGCNQPECCSLVCDADPTCCDAGVGGWDSSCANLVLSGQFSSCVIPPDSSSGNSPDLTARDTALGMQGFQFYSQSGPRAVDQVDVADIGTTWIGARGSLGFSGHGFALKEMDDFQNLIWEYYQGGNPETNPYTRGGTVKVGVIESSAYTMHEDFILAGPAKNPTRPWDGPLLGEPMVTLEQGQSPIYAEAGGISANHGTNVMGVILAADNGLGITGIASRSKGFFYPTVSAENGFRGSDAISSCMRDFQGGDVMNLSWGLQGILPYFADRSTPTVTGGNPVQPLTSDAAYSVLLTTATDLGITSVLAAGAGPAPIAGSGEADAGVILVTAVWPGNMLVDAAGNFTSGMPGYRLCSVTIDEENLSLIRYPGSNWQDAGAANQDETADASAWGYGVVTTGATTSYNNTTVPNPETYLFKGVNDQPPSKIAPGLQVDQLRTYSQSFGGTSAAAAMISGVVARMQAAAKQFYGTPLAPAQIRSIISAAPNAYAQCGCSTGSAIDLPFFEDNLADTCAPPGCAPECIPTGCNCEVHIVGPLPNLQQVPATILSIDPGSGGDTPDSGDSTAVDVQVVTGGQVAGYAWSPFQVRADDGNYLNVVAKRMSAGTNREGLTYIASGLTTDVRVTSTVTLTNAPQAVTTLGLRVYGIATRNFVMCGVFVKNWSTGRYEYFGSEFLTTDTADEQHLFPMPNLGSYSPYVNPSNSKIDMRVWTCGLGSTGRHIVKHDLIQIVVNAPLNPL
jgi:Subtilase family